MRSGNDYEMVVRLAEKNGRYETRINVQNVKPASYLVGLKKAINKTGSGLIARLIGGEVYLINTDYPNPYASMKYDRYYGM